MPQMMPLNWIFYFILFVIIFIMFNIMNYYIFNTKISNKNTMFSLNKKNFNWKW